MIRSTLWWKQHLATGQTAHGFVCLMHMFLVIALHGDDPNASWELWVVSCFFLATMTLVHFYLYFSEFVSVGME